MYDATGTKLRKTTKVGATVQYVQDYLPNGIEYRQTGTGVKRVESVYHAEGRYYNTNVDAADAIVWRKEYSFRDYLGNTRLAFTDRNANGIVDITGTASTSDVLQENHYYSFGLAFEGPWLQNDAGVRDNAYMYNGKELHSDFGLGMYAYGARYYDPVIGRFTGVDPIADEFPFVTTFNYAENEPIANIDLHGLQKFSFKELADRTAVFIAGTANAISSNLAGGAGRGNPNDFGRYANSARNGQTVGDAISVVIGLAETTVAIAGVVGEGLLAPVSGGASALAIAPTVAVGVHGTMTATTGAQNLVKATSGDDDNNKDKAGSRAGKPFTPKEGGKVIDANQKKYDGKIICEGCKVETTKPQKSQKGVTPPKTDRQIDHIKPKSKGGSGTAENGQVLCRDCNRKKSDN
ncbi:RHS repeat-associated core domain-containing protein [Haliscomenobacter hydrossis]|uniref:RHS repeat-associated core domain protein n=1 Tax=Haliscomenobacter hydrossis (strain ATCC 27775 / DSM 1100 / LMG 10767 / O) TaxID=760192 RepID=F4KYT7_HALH1|nr:RHS repeat-associated core domain-containing protein [Haliscomenobacter hydrossis]AEE51479.1 RHS repeat-associated core domain protein [Haliscomenobacter hydrossis DSM 1100]